MSAIIKGSDTNVTWGTSGSNISGYGIIVSAERANTAEKEEIPDEEGEAEAVVYFNQKGECEFEAITTTALPSVGDFLSVAGIDCIIEECREIWAQKGARRVRMRVTRYVANDFPTIE